MMEQLTDVPESVCGLDARGVVTKRDYQQTFVRLVDQAWRQGARLRLLYQCGPEFRWITPGALWADARLGRRYLPLLDGSALVSDQAWVRNSTKGIAAWMPVPTRVFGTEERDAAVAWLESLPERSGVTPRETITAYLGGIAGAIGGLASRSASTRR